MVQSEPFPEELQLLQEVEIKKQGLNQDIGKEEKRKTKESSLLYKLNPFLDNDGLMRIGGRLNHSSAPYQMKHPVILPKKAHVTNLIICHYHVSFHHQGRGITHKEIRSNSYWIVGGSTVVSNHIFKCIYPAEG